MPKRRRLLTPSKKPKTTNRNENDDDVVSSARGRLKGALTDAFLESHGEDPNPQKTPVKSVKHDNLLEEASSEEDESDWSPTSSYVLKLFDRSVDLSQFKEDSPLYPICRAWMLNQPKVNYKRYGKKTSKEELLEDGIELPNPEGPLISRIPSLVPEQQTRDKNNINLDYSEAPPPIVEELLHSHLQRWSSVRQAWVEQAAKADARYAASQQILDQMYSAI